MSHELHIDDVFTAAQITAATAREFGSNSHEAQTAAAAMGDAIETARAAGVTDDEIRDGVAARTGR